MGEKAFYKNFLSIYITLVLQNVVTLSVNLADNVMIGTYSEISLAGVAAVNQIQFIYQQLITALGDGLVIFGSRYWGKRQIRPLKKIAASAMHMALMLAMILSVAGSIFPEGIVGIFTEDQPIIEEGVNYLSVIRFTYVFFAISQLLLAALRSTETVRIAFQLSILTFFVNCGINYLLIFGNLGAPRLGVKGAAIGTLTARIVELSVLIFYIKTKEKALRFHYRDYFQVDKKILGDYCRITVPILAAQRLWGLNTALQTVILGHMTSIAIAANSIASTLFLLVKSSAVGAASAASVVIGKTIGEGAITRAKEYSRKLQRIFVVIGLISGVFLFFIRLPVLSLYDLKMETKEMADAFLIVLSIVCVGMTYQMPTNNGIIRGGGNIAFVVKMDLISIWLIVLPLSFVAAFVMKESPVVVVCCLNADQIFKCVPAFLESHYGNWIRKLT